MDFNDKSATNFSSLCFGSSVMQYELWQARIRDNLWISEHFVSKCLYIRYCLKRTCRRIAIHAGHFLALFARFDDSIA